MGEIKIEVIAEAKKCLNCGSKKFRQEISEVYGRYLDSDCKVIYFEDELTHDFNFGEIRCVK